MLLEPNDRLYWFIGNFVAVGCAKIGVLLSETSNTELCNNGDGTNVLFVVCTYRMRRNAMALLSLGARPYASSWCEHTNHVCLAGVRTYSRLVRAQCVLVGSNRQVCV